MCCRNETTLSYSQLIHYTETLSEIIACNPVDGDCMFDIWLVNYDINDGKQLQLLLNTTKQPIRPLNSMTQKIKKDCFPDWSSVLYISMW